MDDFLHIHVVLAQLQLRLMKVNEQINFFQISCSCPRSFPSIYMLTSKIEGITCGHVFTMKSQQSIKVQKYVIILCALFRFLVCFQYFKLSLITVEMFLFE